MFWEIIAVCFKNRT